MKRLKSSKFEFLMAFSALLFIPLQVYAQAGFGTAEKLNKDWSFSLEQSSVVEVSNLNPDPIGWQSVDLPHDWTIKGNIDSELYSCTGYLPGGIGWYRKTISIPSSEPLGNQVFLYFEGFYNRSEVYLNGHLLGKRPNGYVSFFYDATPYVNFDSPNTISVRVDHSREYDSRWYTGSGIYRDVWLVRSQAVHLDQWGVYAYPEVVSSESGELQVETDVVNESDEIAQVSVKHELISPSGAVVGSVSRTLSIDSATKQTVVSELTIKQPQLWDLEKPNLYTLKTTVLLEDHVVDQSSLKTGFRQFEFSPDKGFSLNGKNLKMKGVCLHHDAGVLGAVVPRAVWKKRLETLKSIGCNAIRTSHNPQATDLYDLCDELGLLVLNEAFDEWEFPKRKWLDGWNVGEPGFQGSYDFFEEWSERDLADMVRRDRNHISVFAWSIGNEVDYPNDPYTHPILDGSEISQPMYGGYKPESPDATRLGDIAKRLVAVVKQYDLSRPVTAALAGVVMSNETEYPSALDIVGYNYTESRYQHDHQTYPERVLYGSENRHDYPAWKAVIENQFVFGQFLWTGIDYLGEAGRWPSRGSGAGLLDYGGFVKPRGEFRKALWSEVPEIYIGTMPVPDRHYLSIDAQPLWDYPEKTNVRVLCYTNAAQAKLLLDGALFGEMKPFDTETGIIYWDVPFQTGTLEVVGYDDDGNEIARDTIVPYGSAVQMHLSCETKTIRRDEGLAMIDLQVVDASGNRVMNASHEVICEVRGPAKLLGLENSNRRDMSDYSDAVIQVFHGRLLAYVQTIGEPGTVEVIFRCEGLPTNSLTLLVE